MLTHYRVSHNLVPPPNSNATELFQNPGTPKPSDVVFCQGSALSLEGILTAAAKREDDGAYAEPLGAWLDELTGTGNQSAGDQSAGEETIWFTLKFERWKWMRPNDEIVKS